MKKLNGVKSKKKYEKVPTLGNMYEAGESAQNQRVLEYLIYDMQQFQRELQDHGIRE